MTTLRTDYVAVNSRGVKLYTFNDAAKARAWVRSNASLHDGHDHNQCQKNIFQIQSLVVNTRRHIALPAARDKFAKQILHRTKRAQS